MRLPKTHRDVVEVPLGDVGDVQQGTHVGIVDADKGAESLELQRGMKRSSSGSQDVHWGITGRQAAQEGFRGSKHRRTTARHRGRGL